MNHQSPESDSNNCWRLQSCSRIWHRDVCPCVPTRYVLALVSCLGFINIYILRVNLSVAILQMDATTASVTNTSARTFEWTSQEEGWILSSFFFGYLISQIPGGWMAGRYGGRWIFGIGTVMTAIFTLFTPLAAYWHIGALIAVRVAEGMFEGVTLPAMHAIWAKWAPPSERSILTTISYSGPHIGSIISFPVSALLCRYGFDGGWPSVFYVFGAIGILWFFLWIFVGYSSPASHPHISARERAHIEESLAEQGTEEQIPIPWLHILISPAVWAIIIAHFCNNWGFYTLLTCMPTYFKQAMPSLQIGSRTDSVVLSGVYSMFPYILMAPLVLSGGFLADWMRKKIHTTIVRKILTLVPFILSGSFLLLCGYLGTTTATAVTFLTIAVGSHGLSLSGFGCNHLDIAPRYAGVLMGLTNAVATIPGIIGPYIAKAIAHKPSAAEGTSAYLVTYRNEWQEVFIISVELYAFGSIIYLFLASGRKQYWADGWPPRSHRGDAAETPVISKDSASLQPPSEKTKLLIQNESDGYVLVNYL